MKKLMMILALLLFAGSASATNTFSPTITQTFTNTPTPTLTRTQTPGSTPVVQQVKDASKYRDYVAVGDLTTGDGVTLLNRTPVANGAYVAATGGIASAVIAVATPGQTPVMRVNYTVPNDFNNGYPIQLWASMYCDAAVTTNELAVNAYKRPYMGNAPASTFLGVTRNVNALSNSVNLASVTYTVKRVRLPMPLGLSNTSKGDHLTFEIVRVAGTGNLWFEGSIEVEYAPLVPQNR